MFVGSGNKYIDYNCNSDYKASVAPVRVPGGWVHSVSASVGDWRKAVLEPMSVSVVILVGAAGGRWGRDLVTVAWWVCDSMFISVEMVPKVVSREIVYGWLMLWEGKGTL